MRLIRVERPRLWKLDARKRSMGGRQRLRPLLERFTVDQFLKRSMGGRQRLRPPQIFSLDRSPRSRPSPLSRAGPSQARARVTEAAAMTEKPSTEPRLPPRRSGDLAAYMRHPSLSSRWFPPKSRPPRTGFAANYQFRPGRQESLRKSNEWRRVGRASPPLRISRGREFVSFLASRYGRGFSPWIFKA